MFRRLVAMLAYMREHRARFEAFNVTTAEEMLSQGDGTCVLPPFWYNGGNFDLCT